MIAGVCRQLAPLGEHEPEPRRGTALGGRSGTFQGCRRARPVALLARLNELLADSRLLGGVARHGANEAARRAAFDVLRERGDTAEILAVAMRGDHKDAAVLAVDVMAERAPLEQIVARSLNKAAVKRAVTDVRLTASRARPGSC